VSDDYFCAQVLNAKADHVSLLEAVAQAREELERRTAKSAAELEKARAELAKTRADVDAAARKSDTGSGRGGEQDMARLISRALLLRPFEYQLLGC